MKPSDSVVAAICGAGIPVVQPTRTLRLIGVGLSKARGSICHVVRHRHHEITIGGATGMRWAA